MADEATSVSSLQNGAAEVAAPPAGETGAIVEVLALFPDKLPDLDVPGFPKVDGIAPIRPEGSPTSVQDSPRQARLRTRRQAKERREIISLFGGTPSEVKDAEDEVKRILQESQKKELSPAEQAKLEDERKSIDDMLYLAHDGKADKEENEGMNSVENHLPKIPDQDEIQKSYAKVKQEESLEVKVQSKSPGSGISSAVDSIQKEIEDWLEDQLSSQFGHLKSIHEAAAEGDIGLLRNHYFREDSTTDSIISMTDVNGHTPLYFACLNGKDESVLFLLKRGALTDAESIYAAAAGGFAIVLSRLLSVALMVNDESTHHVQAIKRFAQMESTMGSLINFQSQRNDGYAPLHISCQRGHEPTVSLLLAQPTIKANLTVGRSSQTPIFLAAAAGHHETVAVLLKHPQIIVEIKASKKTDFVNITPLWIAAQNDRYRIIFLLLEYLAEHPGSVNVNGRRTDNGQSPIFVAALRGNDRIVELLASQPSVDVNASDVRGTTPLSAAASVGHMNIVRELERQGGLSKDPKRMSASNNVCNIVAARRREKREEAARERKIINFFLEAARTGDANFVRNLLDEGVDPPPRALHLACSNEDASKAMAMAYSIIETGKCDVNATNAAGESCLYVACAHEHEELVRYLVAHPKVDVNKPTGSLETPLIVSCRNGFKTIATILLNTPHIDINQCDSSGNTPLHWATENCHAEVIELLLFQGRTDKHIANHAGETPRQLAAVRLGESSRAEYERVISLLDRDRKSWIS
eukprot:g4150.t1